MMKIQRDEDAQPSLFQSASFSVDVQKALDPSIEALRHNRTWHLSRPRMIGDRWLWGKLGFERRAHEQETRYSGEDQDFVTTVGAADRGTFAYYVLDLERQYLLFETKPPDIRPNSFAGALRQVLRETYRDYHFVAEWVNDTALFQTWLTEVDRVTRVHVSLRRPNPGFSRRPRIIREILEKTGAKRAVVETLAATNEGLTIEGTELEALAIYAGEAYGDVRATGRVGDRVRFFDSRRRIRGTDISLPSSPGEDIVEVEYQGRQDLVRSGLIPPAAAIEDAVVATLRETLEALEPAAAEVDDVVITQPWIGIELATVEVQDA